MSSKWALILGSSSGFGAATSVALAKAGYSIFGVHFDLRSPLPNAVKVQDDVKAAGRKAAGLDDLHATLTRLLGEQHTMFEEAWQHLTLPQRAVLRAVVIEDGRELLSADVRARHRLPGASTVQAALAALVRYDTITKDGGRYAVVDSLFREWVARKTF